MYSDEVQSVEALVAALAAALHDAADRFGLEMRDGQGGAQVDQWTQCWGNMACGFGGFAGAALTTSSIIVVRDADRKAAVYIAGRFAYAIESPNITFWQDFAHRHLAGAEDVRLARGQGDGVVSPYGKLLAAA